MILRSYTEQGNCFCVKRNSVPMAYFEMEYQAEIFIQAMIDRFHLAGQSAPNQGWEITGQYVPGLSF